MTDSPVCVSTWSLPGQKHFQAFLATAQRHGIEPVNADSEFWPGASWQDKEWFRKSLAQLRFIREHASRYSHFLFCDAFDIVFSAGWDEIIAKFEKFDSPIVFGAESYPWPKIEQASLYPETPHRCKYLNAGFWMAKPYEALELLSSIEPVAAKRELCDQAIVVNAFLGKTHPIKLDTACSMFFCMNLDSPRVLDFSGPRIKTIDTGEYPCLYHGNGNSDLLPVITKLGQL